MKANNRNNLEFNKVKNKAANELHQPLQTLGFFFFFFERLKKLIDFFWNWFKKEQLQKSKTSNDKGKHTEDIYKIKIQWEYIMESI